MLGMAERGKFHKINRTADEGGTRRENWWERGDKKLIASRVVTRNIGRACRRIKEEDPAVSGRRG